MVYVPPFSGIGVQETRYDRPYQDMLIGQGKAGDIMRNLHVVFQKSLNDRLRSLIRHKNGQLIVATHSEVFINAAAPERILSF